MASNIGQIQLQLLQIEGPHLSVLSNQQSNLFPQFQILTKLHQTYTNSRKVIKYFGNSSNGLIQGYYFCLLKCIYEEDNSQLLSKLKKVIYNEKLNIKDLENIPEELHNHTNNEIKKLLVQFFHILNYTNQCNKVQKYLNKYNIVNTILVCYFRCLLLNQSILNAKNYEEKLEFSTVIQTLASIFQIQLILENKYYHFLNRYWIFQELSNYFIAYVENQTQNLSPTAIQIQNFEEYSLSYHESANSHSHVNQTPRFNFAVKNPKKKTHKASLDIQYQRNQQSDSTYQKKSIKHNNKNTKVQIQQKINEQDKTQIQSLYNNNETQRQMYENNWNRHSNFKKYAFVNVNNNNQNDIKNKYYQERQGKQVNKDINQQKKNQKQNKKQDQQNLNEKTIPEDKESEKCIKVTASENKQLAKCEKVQQYNEKKDEISIQKQQQPQQNQKYVQQQQNKQTDPQIPKLIEKESIKLQLNNKDFIIQQQKNQSSLIKNQKQEKQTNQQQEIIIKHQENLKQLNNLVTTKIILQNQKINSSPIQQSLSLPTTPMNTKKNSQNQANTKQIKQIYKNNLKNHQYRYSNDNHRRSAEIIYKPLPENFLNNDIEVKSYSQSSNYFKYNLTQNPNSIQDNQQRSRKLKQKFKISFKYVNIQPKIQKASIKLPYRSNVSNNRMNIFQNPNPSQQKISTQNTLQIWPIEINYGKNMPPTQITNSKFKRKIVYKPFAQQHNITNLCSAPVSPRGSIQLNLIKSVKNLKDPYLSANTKQTYYKMTPKTKPFNF